MRARSCLLSGLLACGRVGFGGPDELVANLPPRGAPVLLTGSCTLTTGSGATDCPFQVVSTRLASGETVDALSTKSFTVDAGATIRLIGAVPFMVSADVVAINGVLDASAVGATPGAGGFAPGQGPGAGQEGLADTNDSSGGGGGGFATEGGDGRGDKNVAQGGVAYAAIGTIQGGSGGGKSQAAGPCPATTGGAGGGAIWLLGDSITLGPQSVIAAGGGGGKGAGTSCSRRSGGGGGSGGVIVLSADVYTLLGSLYANGGGGGGSAWDMPNDGEDARRAVQPAKGGSADEPSHGGDGGAKNILPTDGGSFAGGAGGGGSAGVIRIHGDPGPATAITASPATTIVP